LFSWASSLIWLPGPAEANPHCVDSASCSSGKKPLASLILAASWSAGSIRSNLVETSPSTTVLSSGTSPSAEKEPDRSSSYSSRNVS
jgi:hypothetical protein